MYEEHVLKLYFCMFEVGLVIKYCFSLKSNIFGNIKCLITEWILYLLVFLVIVAHFVLLNMY